MTYDFIRGRLFLSFALLLADEKPTDKKDVLQKLVEIGPENVNNFLFEYIANRQQVLGQQEWGHLEKCSFNKLFIDEWGNPLHISFTYYESTNEAPSTLAGQARSFGKNGIDEGGKGDDIVGKWHDILSGRMGKRNRTRTGQYLTLRRRLWQWGRNEHGFSIVILVSGGCLVSLPLLWLLKIERCKNTAM